MKSLDSLLTLWQARSERERKFLLAGALFVFFFLIYTAIVSPLQNKMEALQSQLSSNRLLLNWSKPRIEALAKNQDFSAVKKLEFDEMITTVDDSLKNSTLKLKLLETNQTEGEGIQLRFKEVPFNDLLQWLADQHTHYHIEVRQLSATASSTNPGLADVTLVLYIKN